MTPGVPGLRLLGKKSRLKKRKLVLASLSPRRKKLLAGLGLKFEVLESGVNEGSIGERDPERLVLRLAEAKALAGRNLRPEAVVIAADTEVVRDVLVFGKPENKADARRMLRRLSGAEHVVMTGVCVVDGRNDVLRSTVVTTKVRFRVLDDEDIDRYVKTGEHEGKAGAYAIQGFGALLVDGIEGDYSNVVGLPVGATLALLAEVLDESDGTKGTSA